MGTAQRTKGATYEREVAHAMGAALGRTIKRNIGQARDGGNDLDVGPLVVECKRRKTLTTLMGWMEQAGAAARTRAAGTPGHEQHIPTVVMREDNGSSVIAFDLGDFLDVFGSALARHPQTMQLPASPAQPDAMVVQA